MGRSWGDRHPTHGKWNYRSFAVCGGCGRYRYHDALDPSTACLCGQEWGEADTQKAKWYKQQRDNKKGGGTGGGKDEGEGEKASTSPEELLAQLKKRAEAG